MCFMIKMYEVLQIGSHVFGFPVFRFLFAWQPEIHFSQPSASKPLFCSLLFTCLCVSSVFGSTLPVPVLLTPWDRMTQDCAVKLRASTQTGSPNLSSLSWKVLHLKLHVSYGHIQSAFILSSADSVSPSRLFFRRLSYLLIPETLCCVFTQ